MDYYTFCQYLCCLGYMTNLAISRCKNSSKSFDVWKNINKFELLASIVYYGTHGSVSVGRG